MTKSNTSHDSKPTNKAELEQLNAQEQEIQERIKKLQDFVEHGPEKARAEEADRMCTLPPPAEVKEREREKQFMQKLSRGELKNEKRHQAKSGLLLALLIIATICISLWIYSLLK